MEKKENTRKVGVKNYLILALIFIAATAVTIYLCSVYNVYQEDKLQVPVIRGTLSEITSEELDPYISENPTVMMYICTASNETCRKYEKSLKKYIVREELQERMVYLNITTEEAEKFADSFNEKYTTSLKLKDRYPALIIFEEGKVTHLLQAKENEKLTITKTKQFMELHGIGE